MNLLFVAYGGGHINALLPVARLAQESGHSVRIIGLTTAQRVATGAGFDPDPLSAFLEHGAAGAGEYGDRLAADLKGGQIDHSESVAYLGISFAEMVEDFGEDEAWQIYERYGRSKFLPVQFFTRVLSSLRPDAVIATSAPRSERAAILAADKLGIPSVCVVDLFAMAESEWLKDNRYASVVCVLSDEVKSRLISLGRSDGDIVVTGNPAFDELVSDKFVQDALRYRDKMNWQDRFVVGWASQVEPAVHPFTGQKGDPDLPERIESALMDWTLASSDRALVVRHHPSEVRAEPIVGPSIQVSRKDQPVEVLLHACDCLVTIASTVGLQAALVGRPVITYDASVLSKGAPYSEMGVSVGVNALTELAPAIEMMRSGAWRCEAGLARPGDSASSVLACVESLQS